MKRSYTEFLQDIVDAIDEAESFVDGISFDVFASNREKILAIVKLLEIIVSHTTLLSHVSSIAFDFVDTSQNIIQV